MSGIRIGSKKKALSLKDVSAEPPKGVTKEQAEKRFSELSEELAQIQEELWCTRKNSVMIVLQGRDGAGKDGVVKHVAGSLNPRGISTVSFGVPSIEEREHDFLWRIHKQAPRHGEWLFLNRSHYEDVLVVRVHELAEKNVWKKRFDHINSFESMLHENGTIVLKYFLHIDKDEQEKRLLEREKDPKTAWKLNPRDWQERDHWSEYTEAYDDVFEKCSSDESPWTIIPANSKWFRNMAMAESIIEELQPYRKQWQDTMKTMGDQARERLEQWRLAQKK